MPTKYKINPKDAGELIEEKKKINTSEMFEGVKKPKKKKTVKPKNLKNKKKNKTY